MSDVKFIYVTIQYLYLILMTLSAFWVAKAATTREYWRRSIVPIFIFSFVHGLRWARDQDYAGYFYRFSAMKDGHNPDEYEYIFFKICDIFNAIGLPYWFFILCCSIIFIVAIMFVVENFRFALPFVFLIMFYEVRSIDNLVRFYLAFSFYLFSIGFIIRGKIKHALVSMLIAGNIHVGFLIVLPFCFLYKFLDLKSLPKSITSIAFVGLLFVGSTMMLLYFSEYLTFFSYLGSEKADFYVDSYERIVNGEFGAGAYEGRVLTNNIRLVIAWLPGILWGEDILKKYIDKNATFIYNMYVIGSLTFTVFSLVEILDRLNTCFTFFSLIVNGVMAYYAIYDYNKDDNLLPSWGRNIVYLAIFASFWPILTHIPNRYYDNYMLFLWDSNGRDCIPSNIYPMTGR